MAEVRLQKYLSDCGVASRRDSETLIKQGRVEVNGAPAELGQSVDPATARVRVDGVGVHPPREPMVLAMHKPKGVVCSASDPQGRPTVYRLLPPLPLRVQSIGRLDLMTEGLLLFTNDGDLARALTLPKGGVERVYEVKIQGDLPEWAIQRLQKGVTLEDGRAAAKSVERLRSARTNHWLKVVMGEGRYREVRRMFASMGFNVLKLKRVRFGPIGIGRTKPGEVWALSPQQVQALREAPGKKGRDTAGDEARRDESPEHRVRKPRPTKAERAGRGIRGLGGAAPGKGLGGPGAADERPERPARRPQGERPEIEWKDVPDRHATKRGKVPYDRTPEARAKAARPGSRREEPQRKKPQIDHPVRERPTRIDRPERERPTRIDRASAASRPRPAGKKPAAKKPAAKRPARR